MKILYYDCFAGISGDMNLGALIDLGVNPDYLRQELQKLNIDGFQLKTEKAARRGINGTLATIIIENPENEKHRHLRHIEEIVNSSTLSDQVKKTALNIFNRIAVAEAKVHDIDIQKVHFHEVGALDSIADIVGAAICLDYLKVDKVLSSPVQLGGGTVKCAHGIMPVPAPATALIVENIPVRTGLVQHEATTPTGAAILAATVDEFTNNIEFPISKTAYGIGQRDVSEVANVLRVYLLESSQPDKDVKSENATVLECNIDDMKPEHFEFLMDILLDKGASDVWFTPIVMKKSRPAQMISVLCVPDKAKILKEVLFKHSTTLGIREQHIQKHLLTRDEQIVTTEYGDVHIKLSYYGGKVLHSKPEFEDCKLLAVQNNVSVSDIEKAALNALQNEN
ncbi:nickel pincer cofactor biosynthesis protein LarC [Saccharicrinis sp. FJH62]|uniref:nickel pincer cofactor biosynthesis protein LarC n=1 Tax=Saccharicrinis sp. FJH62 TaxID=3344657 RepID=UPI0035D422C6